MLSVTPVGPAHAPAFAFLPGIAMSGSSFAPVAAHLPDIPSVLVDLPGHGGSRDIPWSSIADTASSVLATLPETVTTLAGVSLGAYVGLTMLALAPDRFQHALLSGLHPGDMPNPRLMRVMSYAMAPLVPRPFFAARNARAMGLQPEDIDTYVAGARQTRPLAFAHATCDVVDFSLPEGLERVSTRVLIAAGTKEHGTILEGQSKICAALPNARACRASGLGHAWPAQDTARFAALLHAHVEGRDWPAGVEPVSFAASA
ncbi:alpha/beta fold hydrolase [Tateyamaria omphalii]|uniref:alpha/beta fold hydrolase n=1 Tax=Tateyamaria omphalii TaxID=299262 RepID=UPI001C994A11|nr:alpha/beta fold hydrolase [Tateyamaria omphalii]MBY5931397.1 alpha/beta fold hydrolase [Tateyamaria omphalii]